MEENQISGFKPNESEEWLLIRIPQGKNEKWNEQGLLQLVDAEQEKPQDNRPITERVKTFEDAYDILIDRANHHNDVLASKLTIEWSVTKESPQVSDETKAYMQLCIIIAALNEGWTPTFSQNEYRWYPYFILWTQEEIDDMSEQEKDDKQLLLWGGNANLGSYCGVSYSASLHGWSHTYAGIGSRLAYHTEALATYAGRQFASVYARFYLGEFGAKAKPWREFEQVKAADPDSED